MRTQIPQIAAIQRKANVGAFAPEQAAAQPVPHADLAADISDKTIANAIKNGINEHYDSISGKPLGVQDYCMSSTLVTMMLDGLTQKHKMKLRDKRPAP